MAFGGLRRLVKPADPHIRLGFELEQDTQPLFSSYIYIYIYISRIVYIYTHIWTLVSCV